LSDLRFPRRWYPVDVVQVLVRSSVAQPISIVHAHAYSAPNESKLRPFDPYRNGDVRFGDDERLNETHKLRSSPDPPAGMGCPLVTDRPAAHTGTIAILHTTSHIRLGSELDLKVPFLRHFGSVVQNQLMIVSNEHSLSTAHQSQGMIINHLIQIMRCPRILSWEPSLDQRCSIVTFHEMLLEPRQR